MPKFTINLVTWNGERFIDVCLSSVLAQTYKDYSVLIIDNGSSDNTKQIIAERFPQFKVIAHKDNLGFARAHNQAIHWTDSEYVVCLNQDIVLDPKFLEQMADFLDKNQAVGAVTGKICRLDEDLLPTKYIDTVGLKIFKNLRVVDQGSGEMDEGQYDVFEQVFGVSGCVPVYRRRALKTVEFSKEFFDENFFIYKEDVDLSFRLRVRGWPIWRVSSAIAYHARTIGAPLEKLSVWKIAKNHFKRSTFGKFYSYRNHLYFIYKCAPKFSLAILFYEKIKAVYLFFTEPRIFFRAWRGFFKDRLILKEKRKFIYNNLAVKIEDLKKWWQK
ncbi:MAG: glycosyltransferase family 2 protein [Patescibacteria group bacterium]